MRLIIFIILFFVQLHLFAQQIKGKVVKIIDGDTFELLLSNNKTFRIRMNGIDCPEKKQPFYLNAKKSLSNYIFGKNVSLLISKKDKYKRSVADVYVGEEYINLKMIANGFAWHFKKYSNNKLMAAAEMYAKQRKLGLWNLPNAIAPWDWRDGKYIKNKKPYFFK